MSPQVAFVVYLLALIAWAAFGYTPEQRTRMATVCHPAGHTGTGHPASPLPAVGHAPSNHTA